MNDYIPTEDEIREWATQSFSFAWNGDGFDGFIASVKAKAWDEGAEHAAMRPDLSANPYRQRKEA